MSFPETSDAVKFPKRSFIKTYDEIVVRGEVFRSKTHKSHLGARDKKYDISVKLSKEDYLALKKFKIDGNTISGLKKVMLPVKDDAGEPILDDEGEPVTEFSHYQISFAQNAVIKGKQSKIKDIRSKKGLGYKPETRIGEGSDVAVKGSIWFWTFEGEPGCSLNLSAIAIYDLKEFTYDNDNFGGMELGDDFEDVNDDSDDDDDDDSSGQGSTQTNNPTDDEGGSGSGGGPIDFDDDIPF